MVTASGKRVPLAIEDLRRHLSTQLGLLKRSAEAFDQGLHDEAQRLALGVRILCHDTKRQKSLLSQLGMKQRRFLDTCPPDRPGNLLSFWGLLTMRVTRSGAAYRAPLDDTPTPPRSTAFGPWWDATIFRDQAGERFSRGRLILTMADQDGGAHVDSGLDAAYANLAHNNALNVFFSSDERSETAPVLGNPERYATRQIAHEVLRTMVSDYPVQSEAPETVLRHPGDPGRNARCWCDSGLRFKHCHGAPDKTPPTLP
jgi:hypothetical protein